MIRSLVFSLLILTASMASAYETRPAAVACRPTLEKWEATHGRKFVGEPDRWGHFLFGELRWNDGKRVMAMVGPDVTFGGFCVLSQQLLTDQRAQTE